MAPLREVYNCANKKSAFASIQVLIENSGDGLMTVTDKYGDQEKLTINGAQK